MKKNLKTRIGGGGHRSLNQQPSGFTPILGLRKSETLKKKIKAFTLAEVLITLAIIGVVAALTIPSVVAKYQKKQLYTQFIKVYNTLSDVMSLSVAENGTPDTWGIDTHDHEIIENITKKNILPYLKVSKKIVEDDTEFNYSISYLNGEQEDDPDSIMSWTDSDNAYLLSDGSIVDIWFNSNLVGFSFDINGKKGPNTYGRDVFLEGFCYEKVDGQYKGLPCYMSDDSGDSKTLKTREQLYEGFLGNDFEFACNTNVAAGALNCASRLLLEGKMDY